MDYLVCMSHLTLYNCIKIANIRHFQAIFQMPMRLDPARPGEGWCIEETLGKHNDKYHQTCCMLYNITKLAQTKKREIQDGKDNKMRRTMLGVQFECLLWEEELPPSVCIETCHDKAAQSETTPVIYLNEGGFLAKLVSGDVIVQDRVKEWLNSHILWNCTSSDCQQMA